jgi:hypothetical protein
MLQRWRKLLFSDSFAVIVIWTDTVDSPGASWWNSNARIAVLVSYGQTNSDSREMSFAVFVLREDAMVADNLVVENVVHLEYREKAVRCLVVDVWPTAG